MFTLTSALSSQDVTLRLQQLISHWGGAQRGQPLTDLHKECLDAVGKGSQLHYRLLSAHILSVADLDATHLQQALRRFNGLGRSITLEFRVIPMGRFDAALIPVGRVGEQPDRWLLALEQGVPVQDQVALYGHAVGHLLLNYQEEPCYPNAQPGAVYRASRPCARSTLYWLRYWQLIRIT